MLHHLLLLTLLSVSQSSPRCTAYHDVELRIPADSGALTCRADLALENMMPGLVDIRQQAAVVFYRTERKIVFGKMRRTSESSAMRGSWQRDLPYRREQSGNWSRSELSRGATGNDTNPAFPAPQSPARTAARAQISICWLPWERASQKSMEDTCAMLQVFADVSFNTNNLRAQKPGLKIHDEARHYRCTSMKLRQMHAEKSDRSRDKLPQCTQELTTSTLNHGIASGDCAVPLLFRLS